MATKIKDLIRRDIAVKIEGVVKVYDRAALASEIREFVVTDKIEEELKRILDTFTQVSESLRRGGKPRDVMGIWLSGFFGSGKSHFAKVLGYLLQNDLLDDGSGECCIEAFEKLLSDSPKARDIRLRLGEIKKTTVIKAAQAGKDGREDDRLQLLAALEEVEVFDRKLARLQEGHHSGAEGGADDYRILTPWKKPEERPKGWRPDLDDGVKVNIAPLARTGLLRTKNKFGAKEPED
jgi:hypothetical protein